MTIYNPNKLLQFNRDGLIEQEHAGIFVLNKNNKIEKIGDDKNYPFFLRSCAKPLQASLLVDLDIINFYNLTLEEIAICSASHAGEQCHTKIVKNLLYKIGLDDSYLKCGFHEPISQTEQKRLLLEGQKASLLHSNCSGKHTMMLAISKKMGFDLTNYFEFKHPLQILIKKKIYELCELNKEYPATKDGCGVPIYSMPLGNILKGYINLFFDDKYSLIKKAFIQNPYLIGGENRLDTAIMTANPDLIAKVGAGGLCVVVNLKEHSAIIVKIMDSDMKARALCLIEALRQLNWLNQKAMENDLIKEQYKTNILTLHGDKVGQAEFLFKI